MEARGLLLFDEARQAVSALEMAQSGNLWVTTFEGKPEMWSTKPPLLIWFMAASIKLFGYSVWALRFPSALASFAVVLLLYKTLLKYTKNLFIAFAGALVLVTAPGFIGEHAARTADYDALLILFTFSYCLSFFKYIETGKPYSLLWTCIFFTLAFLTKSIAACFALPGLVIYGLYSKRFLSVFYKWQLYAGIAFCLILVGGYYIIRERHNPGYMQAVLQNEWGGRYNIPQEDNSGPWYYYFAKLGDWRQFSPAYYFLLPLSIASFYTKGIIQRLSLFSLMLWLSIILVLSASATKLPHYTLPIYPFMAINCGIGLYVLFSALKNRAGSWSYVLLALPLYITISAGFYLNSFLTLHNNNTIDYGHIFDELKEQKPAVKSVKTFVSDYNPGLRYYTNVFNMQGYNITNNITTSPAVGDTLATCEPILVNYIEKHFQYTTLVKTDQCQTLVITGQK